MDFNNILGGKAMTYFMQDNYNLYDLLPCSAAIFLINGNLDIIYSNAVYDEMFASRYVSVHDDDREVFDKLIAEADNPKCVYFRSKNSHGKTISVRAFVIKISEDKAFALFIDDSESIEAMHELDTKCARYEAAISGTDETFFEYSKPKDTFTIFFSSADGVIMRDVEHFIENFENNDFVYDDDKETMKMIFKKDIKKEVSFDVHMRMQHSHSFEWHRIIMKPDGLRDGIFIGSMRNINKSKIEEEKLKEKALIDPLSKVYNRAAAIEKIELLLKKRSKDKECALIVLDIDNFKHINDTFGHLYGDAVIAMAAGSIKSTLDKADILGRFGGDEFFVFIDNAETEQLEKKLEDIRLSILKMRLDKNDDKDISCSIGVAKGAGGSIYEDMFRQADSALYLAKKNGKNRFEYFDGTYFDDGALSYAGNNDEDESNEEHNVIAVALEIASKSTNAESAISSIMRHIGMAEELDTIQIFKYDTIEDKVYIEFQWWRELNGVYNVVITDKKMGYYIHSDLMLFKNRFARDKTFQYTPEFKEGFSNKFRDVFEKSEHINTVYSSNTENESVFYGISYQCFDLDRVWSEDEFADLSEITKILSMYLKSSYVTTEREKMLIKNIDYDWTGLYAMQKFYDEAGRIGRTVRQNGDCIGVMHLDVKGLYEINITHGRGVGDRVMDALIEMFEKADKNKCIAAHIDGTDIFLALFSVHNKDIVADAIEAELNKISQELTKYINPPVIFKVGLGFFEPGAYIVDYLDAVKYAKKNVNFDRTMCIVNDNPKTEYPEKQYQTYDRRKQ